MLADRVPAIQEALEAADLDGWFFCCFQHNDPISLSLLGLAAKSLVTRRCFYLIPRAGEPRRLVHRLEPAMLDHLPGSKATYLRWQELAERLTELVAGCRRLAAQYSPGNALPTISRLDAGTAEALADRGVELVSSADLVQRFAAVWSDAQLAGHRRAATALHEIVHAAFERVGAALASGETTDELAVQRFILDSFERRSLTWEGPPIVGVNAHSADPHYVPEEGSSAPIRAGDFLLIDLFAREAVPDSIWADITWCGVCAPAPSPRQAEIFDRVAAARDAAWSFVESRFPAQPIRGFEVDQAARRVIEEAGYGDRFFHRTGHSIDTSDHGQGANMDDLETHDTRLLVPGTGFSIEPGIYFEGDFGVRSEIGVALTAAGAEITGGDPQRELLRLLA